MEVNDTLKAHGNSRRAINCERRRRSHQGCVHSLGDSQSPIPLQRLLIQTPLIPQNVPGSSRTARDTALLTVTLCSGRICKTRLTAARVCSWGPVAAEQLVSTPTCCAGERARENCFTFCKRIEGGSVISSGIKARRKLLEFPFYKSPFEKHLPSP